MIDWKTAETLGYSYYVARGFRVLISIVDNKDYDFVIEKDGIFSRVNVKLAGLKVKSDPNSWSISKSGSSSVKDAGKKCDIFLTYLPDQGRFIEIDGDHFQGSNSKSKLIPKSLLD